MHRFLSTLAATGLAVLGVSAVADAGRPATAARRPAAPTITVIAVLGAETPVPPGEFVKAFAHCPRGYVVTGGGAFNGAITDVASGPTSDKRAWFVDGANDDPAKRTFSQSADAVCMRGSSGASVRTAAAAMNVREAERAFKVAHPGFAGR